MNQKFSGGIGQVAGRDVKSTKSEATVNIHLHDRMAPGPFVSDRQRRAIGAKVFELQARTGVDKLAVYRRLMSRFEFRSMEELPCNKFERVMRYLDGWMRRGSAERVAVPSAETKATACSAPPGAQLGESRLNHPAPEVPIVGLAIHASASARRRKNPSTWFVVSVATTATIVGTLVVSFATLRGDANPHTQLIAATPQCEYGGGRYSPGSVVTQAGVRRHCVAIGQRAAWRKAEAVAD